MELKPGYKMTEVGVIPEDWEKVQFTEVFKIVSGQVDPRNEPYCHMVLLAPDHLESNSGKIIKKITASEQHAISGKYLFSSGNIIYSKIRPYLKKATVVNFKGICSADMYVFNIINKNNPSFLLNIILGKHFTEYAVSLSSRTGIPKINREDLYKYTFYIPKPFEQQAIAAALSDVDELLSSLDRLIAKKKDIRLATMQELLTGKKRLPGFNSNTTYQKTDLGTFPSDWKILPIHNFTECTSGGTPNTKIHSYWGGKHPWMSSGELHMKYIYNVSKRITDEGLMNSSTKYIPKNSVLIGLAGQGKTRGTVALAKISLCINQSIAAILPSNICNSEYLFYNLNSRYTELREISSGDGGRGGLNLNLVNNIYIPLPSYPEQQAIASVLSDMDAEIEALEARRDKVRNIKTGMMQELLTGKTRLVSAGETA